MRVRCIWLMVLAAFVTAACVAPSRNDRRTEQLLTELDGYVSAREMYVARKKDQMEALSRLARSTQDPYRRYDLEMDMAAQYFAFQFDSTQHYYKHCQELAREELQDTDKEDRALIGLVRLYEKAGSFMEAYTLLYQKIDTLRMGPDRLTEYLLAQYDFLYDLAGNSGLVERMAIPPIEPLRERLLARLPAHSTDWRRLRRDAFVAEGQLARADSLAQVLLSSSKPDQHAYAIHAFFKSEIAGQRGRPAEQFAWLVRSAESDILNSVKDYASLTMVAQHLLSTDVARSFRYVRIAQEDAIFYNAKLRPWQISRFMMQVEDAYSQRQERQHRGGLIAMILLAVMTLVLAVGTWFLIARSRKLTRLGKELEQSNARLAAANEQLETLNQQISQADQVKESHIIAFLQDLAAQISLIRAEDNHFRNLLKQGKADLLLKELSISGRSEKARENFYETFDKTFLSMYPRFVEQFNALLQPQARVQPPKGRLNTELRIFALIHLGVDDSKKIATMLDYSASTIYNYKVSVKNAALGDRENFENAVKSIEK